MPRDSEATRARLLQAAIEEFAAHGLAGGRVDRIAEAAQANKRAIYDYFGSKEALFDLAVRSAAERLTAAVPLEGGDLPGYAGMLFDYVITHPETARLIAWRRLERPDTETPTSEDFFAQLRGVRDPVGRGRRRIHNVDLVILVIALANAWDLAGPEIAVIDGADPADPARIAAHRAAVVEATRRLTERPAAS